jgi:hypothetical protein
MIKNIKVGGTSLEVELSKVLPDNAIVTTINPSNYNHRPRNYYGFYPHIAYLDIEKKIDLTNVKSYVFIRNPYDLQLSMFFYKLHEKKIIWEKLNKKDKEKCLYLFFSKKDDSFTATGSSRGLYTKDGKIVVNNVLKYEDGIELSINPILSKHNIPNISMKTFEKQYRPKEHTVLNTFNQEHLEQIYNDWSWEFDQFGYRQ